MIRMQWNHSLITTLLIFGLATSAWSADVLMDEIINLGEAAAYYIGAGYQLSYVDQTECRKYPYFKKDAANAFSESKNDVGKMIHGSMFNDLLKIIESIQSQLRKEIDVKIGSEPTPFQCGWVKGGASKSVEQSRDNWLRAVRSFNQTKQDQGLTQ